MEGYEKEIETYLERLRKISVWQRNIIIPFLLLVAAIQLYQAYYSRHWGDFLSVALYIGGAVYNYYDSRRTFAKIMFQKLAG